MHEYATYWDLANFVSLLGQLEGKAHKLHENFMWSHVGRANEYLVVTGAFIDEVKITRKTFQLPGQVVTKFAMTPSNYTLSLHAMTIEKLECCCS